MNQQNHHSKNRLGLNLFEANLKRHPSVKGLFDEDGNMKTPSDSKDEYLLLSINNQNENNDTLHYKGVDNDEGQDEGQDEDKENNNKKETMPVQINRVEEKLVNNKETFYVEMNEEDKKEIIRTKKENKKQMSKFSKPLSYEFNDTQKKFDEDINNAIFKGKEYSEIEEKFKDQLKK